MALVRSRPVLHHPFAPWLAPPDQLARTLVGREEALRNIIEKIEAMGKGSAAKHVLIIGPRGMGKTHLVCFIHHYVSQRIDARPDLPNSPQNWTCVLFVEEEYPAHNTLANFLLSLCAKLHEGTPSEKTWELPGTLRNQSDRVVIDCCLERIQTFSANRGEKLLILVDNLQKILQQFPTEDHHRLRAFLMDQTAILLVGTAPWLFKEVIDYKAPFFEFFETIYLTDLTEQEMLRLLEARFREDGFEAEFRSREENLRRKIPAIRKLTGGNPRLILFLYHIVTRSAFLEVESALRELIEELSDYFRGRYDTLADQPRKVLDTLAQMEGPGTPTDIARSARLSVQKVNAQLKRLKEWGYVEPVKHERRRATHYDVTERLFRIWRQTATVAGRQRFRFLAQFLKIYYTPEEAREALEKGLAVAPDDWELLTEREVARACQGEHGPNMEGLATAILTMKIPTNVPPSIVRFLFDVAAKCITRNDLDRARCLLDVAFSMPWQQEEWFGKMLGVLLGKLLDGPPYAFEMAVNKISEKIVEPNVLALLNPYLQAAAYSETGDASILDRLFPEVRELVVEISHRLQHRTPLAGNGLGR